MRILVFSREHAGCYQALEQKGDLSVDLVHSLDQIDSAPYSDRLYSGILIDSPTLLEGQKGDRDLLQDLWDIFPVLLLEVVDGELRPFRRQKFPGTLDEFLAECRAFQARPVRSKDRVEVYLHLELAEAQDMDDPERTATTNVAEKECFAVTGREHACGSTLWVRFAEMEDQTPIRARVCRQASWGQARYLPGVGLKFLELTPSQQEFLKLVTLTS